MSYLVSCNGCGTTTLVPDSRMANPDAALKCRDPEATGCCTLDHDHHTDLCEATHENVACPHPENGTDCTVLTEEGEDCPGGHHSHLISGCAACRSVTISVPEGEGPTIRPGGSSGSPMNALGAATLMLLMRFTIVRLMFISYIAFNGTILERARQTSLLASILNGTTWPTVPAGWKMRLGSTAPTVSAAMTELTGTGYTAGGTAITSNTVSAAACTLPVSTTTWTNGSGSAWSIVGLEIWDTAGTPLRWIWGLWNGQPISVAISNTFQVAAGGVTADATPW